MPRTPKHVF
jgi:hypothetical protein